MTRYLIKFSYLGTQYRYNYTYIFIYLDYKFISKFNIKKC